jgi:hypothetical protein
VFGHRSAEAGMAKSPLTADHAFLRRFAGPVVLLARAMMA